MSFVSPLSEILVQQVLQALLGLKEMGFDCIDRDLENRGDLAILEAAFEAEDETVPLLRRQVRDGPG
jgi:hypothetical protein